MPSHIIATELVCRALGLSGTNYLLAHFFGWGVDVDHIINQFSLFIEEVKSAYINWKKRHFLKKFIPYRILVFIDRFSKKADIVGETRSWIQEPTGILFVLVLSIIIKNYIPVLFLFIHFLMDSLMRFNKYPLAPFTKKLKFKGWIPTNTYAEYIIGGFVMAILIIWRLVAGF